MILPIVHGIEYRQWTKTPSRVYSDNSGYREPRNAVTREAIDFTKRGGMFFAGGLGHEQGTLDLRSLRRGVARSGGRFTARHPPDSVPWAPPD